MSSINSRIREIRKVLKLNQIEFGKIMGMKQGNVSIIEQEGRFVTDKNINLICNYYKVNKEWLRKGTGEMFVINNDNFNQFFSIYNKLSPPLQEFLRTTASNLIDLQNKI